MVRRRHAGATVQGRGTPGGGVLHCAPPCCKAACHLLLLPPPPPPPPQVGNLESLTRTAADATSDIRRLQSEVLTEDNVKALRTAVLTLCK